MIRNSTLHVIFVIRNLAQRTHLQHTLENIFEKTHTFECETCLKKFLFQTNLRRHEIGNSCHNKVTPSPYSCQSCSKAFQTNKSLRQHSLIHKALQNMCTVCEKSFVWKFVSVNIYKCDILK